MRFSVVLATLALAGCAGNQLNHAQAQFQDAVAQCKTTAPPKVVGYVNWANCVNAASERLDHTTAGTLIRATRLQLADKIDRGEMRPADAGAALSQVIYNARLPEQEMAQRNRELDQRNREMWAGVAAAGVLSMAPPPQVNTTVVVPRY